MPYLRVSSRLRWTLAIGLLLAAGGCASSRGVVLREGPSQPLAERLNLLRFQDDAPSPRTEQVLRRYDLAALHQATPAEGLQKLEQAVQLEVTCENLYALSEVAYLAGKKAEASNPKAALDLYGASVVYAYRYLFDQRLGPIRNPYDPQFRGACDLYNSSLENSLRLAQKTGGPLLPGKKHEFAHEQGTCQIEIVSRSRWHNDDFERFEFVSDYEVQGLTNHYRTFGLGVPLIAVRKPHPEQDRAERYYPPGMTFPVTAFLRIEPDEMKQSSERRARWKASIELRDPLETTEIDVCGSPVPIQSDLSTPLAYFLDQPGVSQIGALGLLRPDEAKQAQGLYLSEPYVAGRIPVIMVHGLASDPTTWFEMFNDLRSSSALRDQYQFWFYLYPTAQPFWVSAAQFRRDLQAMRKHLDPRAEEPAHDQLVLVGHSMGGLVSRMQAVQSKDEFWRLVTNEPIDKLELDAETRQRLETAFFFGPNPSIKRVITIGTPHRGSYFANSFTRYVGSRLIELPKMLVQSQQQIVRANPGAFEQGSLLNITTSIDSLAPDSPILPILLNAPPAEWVHFHNIVGVLERDRLATRLVSRGDGIVPFDSAHLDKVDSELVVSADHTGVHAHPLAVLEVRRILLDHGVLARRDIQAAKHVLAESSPAGNAGAERARPANFQQPLEAVERAKPARRAGPLPLPPDSSAAKTVSPKPATPANPAPERPSPSPAPVAPAPVTPPPASPSPEPTPPPQTPSLAPTTPEDDDGFQLPQPGPAPDRNQLFAPPPNTAPQSQN